MKLFAIVVLLSLSPLILIGGEITPGLLQAFEGKGESGELPVLIILEDRVDVQEVSRTLTEQGLPLAERHQQLVEELKTRAVADQANVRTSLVILENAGMVQAVRGFWLTNMIAARVNRDGLELIANIGQVAEVGLDELLHPRDPETHPAEAKLLNVEESLKIISAPDAWADGLFGAGRTICVIGDAVSSTHPALAGRQSEYGMPYSEGWIQAPAMLVVACGADPTTGDTIGVAPAAEWISMRLIQNGASRFSDLIQLAQSAVDPDENAATLQDVPDVICMSWGLRDACESALPALAWEAFDNIEPLGPICIFAAGQSGEEGPSSVTLPEARVGDGASFCAGNLDATAPKTRIHPASGRGPSPCDQSTIKPDVVAPGTMVRTAGGDGYVSATGTGVAAGFVAGAVALMREANPQIMAFDVKRILRETATDLGLSGPDNAYGWGLLNVRNAVEAARTIGSSGVVKGRVRHGGTPLQGARVQLASRAGLRTVTTDANGAFQFSNLPTGLAHSLHIGRFGYRAYVAEDSIRLARTETHSRIYNLHAGVDDDVETDQGWILGVEEDDATGGAWERAIPVPSTEKGHTVQVGKDATENGSYCFVTANAASPDEAAGTNDVDGGRTTLRSPVFSLLTVDEPELTFSYAYSNDRGGQRGGDFFRVQISQDGGATWADLIRTSQSTNGWKEVTVAIEDFVAVTDHMVLQFIADDQPPASLVEAAVDEISIAGKPGAPEPPRDLQLDVQFDQVILQWRPSEGANSYQVYVGPSPFGVVCPENYFTETADTILVVPLEDIPHDEFYFQVTATR